MSFYTASYGGGLHEPGYGSVYGSYTGSSYGPNNKRKRRNFRRMSAGGEGRGRNIPIWRYEHTREGYRSGYGNIKSIRSAWLRNRYRHALERMEKTPFIGPIYQGGKKISKQVDDWLDSELRHVPGYGRMSTRKQQMLRNSLKGWAFERATGPQGLDLWEWFPDLPVGPAIPIPKSPRWFPKKKRKKYYRRRRY